MRKNRGGRGWLCDLPVPCLASLMSSEVWGSTSPRSCVERTRGELSLYNEGSTRGELSLHNPDVPWGPHLRNCILIFFFFWLFRVTLVAYGSSQTRGLIRAIAAGLYYSHSNTRSEPRLWSTPQLMAMPVPWPTEQGQGWNLHPHGY